MTSKQRAYLRGLANSIDPIFQIGKSGLSENLLKQLDDALEARELIKINVLENSGEDVKSLGNGKELWTLSGYVDGPAQFVFNYKEANAWDNNNGRNYRLVDFN